MRLLEFDQDSYSDILQQFIRFAKHELQLTSLPKFKFHYNSDTSATLRSFGGYTPASKSIAITVYNRHIIDVCRTLAHELVHYKQDLDNRLQKNSGEDGSTEENEANAQAAVIMRKWANKYPNMFKLPMVADPKYPRPRKHVHTRQQDKYNNY